MASTMLKTLEALYVETLGWSKTWKGRKRGGGGGGGVLTDLPAGWCGNLQEQRASAPSAGRQPFLTARPSWHVETEAAEEASTAIAASDVTKSVGQKRRQPCLEVLDYYVNVPGLDGEEGGGGWGGFLKDMPAGVEAHKSPGLQHLQPGACSLWLCGQGVVWNYTQGDCSFCNARRPSKASTALEVSGTLQNDERSVESNRKERWSLLS